MLFKYVIYQQFGKEYIYLYNSKEIIINFHLTRIFIVNKKKFILVEYKKLYKLILALINSE